MMNFSKLLVAVIAAFGAFILSAEPNAAYTADATVADALTLEGEYIIDVASGVTVTYTGEISGTGPLRKTGAGTLVLANGKNSFTAGVQISQGYVRADAEGCLGTGRIHIDKTVAGVSSTFGVVRQINFNADGAVFSNDILIEGKDPGASYHYTSSFIRTNVKTTLTGAVSMSVETSSNCYSGISCGTGDVSTGAVLEFKNGFSWPGGYLRCNAYGTIRFDGPLIVSTIAIGYNYDLKGKVEFNSPGNEIGTLSLSGANISLGAPEIFASTVYTLGRVDTRESGRSTINLNGNSQTFTCLSFDNTHAKEKGNYGYVTSADSATLRLKGRSSSATSYHAISGKISLVVDSSDNPSFVQTLMSRAHTMSGTLSVSNGTLIANGATFKNAGEIHVGNDGILNAEGSSAGIFAGATNVVVDGKMTLGTNITTPFTDEAVDLTLGENAELTIPDTMVLRVKTLTVAGKKIGNKTKLGVNGLSLEQLKGGSIIVYDGNVETADAVWTGEGGDTSIDTANNWNVAPALPSFDDETTCATFSSGGTEASVNRAVSFHGVGLSSLGGFTFTKASEDASVLVGEGGLSATKASADSTPTYVFKVPLITKNVNKDNPTIELNVADGATVHADDGLINLFDGRIKKTGGGELSISGNSVISGSLVHNEGTLRFAGNVGAPEGVVQGAPSLLGKNTITVPGDIEGLTTILDGVTFYKPVWMAGRGDVKDSAVNWLQFGAASTNVFKENAVFYTNVGYLNLDAASALVFEKGVDFSSTVHFCDGELVVRGGKMEAVTSSGFYLHRGSLRLETSGNAITLRGRSVRRIDLTVDYAVTNRLFELDASYPQVYLHGTVQHCSNFGGTIGVSLKGGHPSRFIVKKGYLYGRVEEGVSIEMNGSSDAQFTLGESRDDAAVVDHPSTGDLIATAGTLLLAKRALWRNGTNIVVRGTGKLKTSAANQFNREHTVVRFSDDGVLEIPEGVRQTVYDLYVDGVKVPGGMYGGADAPDGVNKTYAGHFAGAGVLRVVRHGMMTIVVR